MYFNKISKEYFIGPDVVALSRDLLGKYLMTDLDGLITGGMIVETEAYAGRKDKACHAHMNKRTNRTRIMYEEGGVAYVYLCYGIHYLFNIITNVAGMADAILIRAIEPKVGIDVMLQRRKLDKKIPRLTAGPGVMSQALGINKTHYGESLVGDLIWLEDRGVKVKSDEIIASTRIGVDYAEEDALLPWRFSLKNNCWVSKGR